MSEEKKFLRGEVYYITSKFDTAVGSEQKGGRPAVIVSNDVNNEHSPCVEICYMTLREKNPIPTHVFINRGSCINSTVLCEQITTISKERIGDYMCTLSDEAMEAIDEALMISLGLDYMFEQEEEDDEVVPCGYAVDSTVADLQARIKELTFHLDCTRKELEVAQEANAVIKEKAAKAHLYEQMYNDLLDRLTRR